MPDEEVKKVVESKEEGKVEEFVVEAREKRLEKFKYKRLTFE